MKHTEGQLFSYTFTLPANYRKYLTLLKKGKRPRKPSASAQQEAKNKGLKSKNGRPAQPTDAGNSEAAKQPRTKQTTDERAEHDRVRSQTQERKEYRRQYQRKQRQIAKETGKCRDCPAPVEPGKVRCEKCRDIHRQDGANRRARLKEERESNSTS